MLELLEVGEKSSPEMTRSSIRSFHTTPSVSDGNLMNEFEEFDHRNSFEAALKNVYHIIINMILKHTNRYYISNLYINLKQIISGICEVNTNKSCKAKEVQELKISRWSRDFQQD